ncbi:MAG TPA: hypothetical protein VJG48_01625 [Candidatus Paceibacterota bacterium]
MPIKWKKLAEEERSPLEEARLFGKLIKEHKAVTVAKHFGCKERRVTDMARIASSNRLSADIKNMWDLGEITFKFTVSLLGKAHGDGMPVREQIKLARASQTQRTQRKTRPRVFITPMAKLRDKRGKGRGLKEVKQSRAPALVPALRTQPEASSAGRVVGERELDKRYPLVGGEFTQAWDVLRVLELARQTDPHTLYRVAPVNGFELSPYAVILTQLLRHWHPEVRGAARALLPKGLVASYKPPKVRRPGYKVVDPALINYKALLSVSVIPDRMKRELFLDFASRLAARKPGELPVEPIGRRVLKRSALRQLLAEDEQPHL